MRLLLDLKSRSSYILAAGFGTLIILIAVLSFGAIRRARAIYNEMERRSRPTLRRSHYGVTFPPTSIWQISWYVTLCRRKEQLNAALS